MVVRPALGETRCVASAVTPVRAPTSPRGSRLAISATLEKARSRPAFVLARVRRRRAYVASLVRKAQSPSPFVAAALLLLPRCDSAVARPRCAAPARLTRVLQEGGATQLDAVARTCNPSLRAKARHLETGVIEKIRRALGVAESRPQITDPLGPGPWYGWRCPCGAHGGGGRGTIRSDAEHLAQRHMLRHPVGHPTPEIYSTEEELA